MNNELKVGSPVFGGRYTLLSHVTAWAGGPRSLLGERGRCRYCSIRGQGKFRKRAHTVPEALGNRWIISLDECDDCNEIFACYDDHLANSVSPFLTLGGIKGKQHKIRQTGRSAGDSVLICEPAGGLSMRTVAEPQDHISLDPIAQKLQFAMPIPGVPFRPRYAYKSVVRTGLALMPEVELEHFRLIRAWLLDKDDAVEFPCLDVAMSFSSISNAPPSVAAVLLRRADPTDPTPYMLFFLCAGSICLQIDLMSDQKDDHASWTPLGFVNVVWQTEIDPGDGHAPVIINYGMPVHRNWSARKLMPQPITRMIFDVDLTCFRGQITPEFRAE